LVASGSSSGPTRNRISWIVVPGAPTRRASNSAGLRNAASSSKSVGCATVMFKIPRRTSPTRVCWQCGSPTAVFQTSSSLLKARSRPYPRAVKSSPRISDSGRGPRQLVFAMLVHSVPPKKGAEHDFWKWPRAFPLFGASTSLEAFCPPVSHSRPCGKNQRDICLGTSYRKSHVGILLTKVIRVPFPYPDSCRWQSHLWGGNWDSKAPSNKTRAPNLSGTMVCVSSQVLSAGQRSRVSGMTTYV
jgi:hypothetical protein